MPPDPKDPDPSPQEDYDAYPADFDLYIFRGRAF